MANSYLNKTFGTPTDTKKYTMSVWVKRATLGVQQSIARSTNGNDDSHVFTFNSDDTLRWDEYGSSSTIGTLKTNRKFRDISAWYHVVLWYDSANSTAGDRMRMWINGVEETSFATDTNPSLNADSAFNKASQPINIGRTSYSGGGNYFDGYLAHMAFVDGANVAHTTFGETDSTSGIWKFKSPSGLSWGNNGFHLKFENSGALGTDSSGQTNNFTVNGNLKQSLDTPSNNHATFNPIDKGKTGDMNFANGSTTTMNTSGFGDYGVRSSLGVTKGKWYWEIKIGSNTSQNAFAILPMEDTLKFDMFGSTPEAHLYGLQRQTDSATNFYSNTTFTSGNTAWGGGITSSDVIGFALDMDNGKLYISKNGTFKDMSGNTSNIGSGTYPTFTIADTDFTYALYVEMRTNDDNGLHINMGDGFFGTTAISSAGSNGNGSLFEYDVPSGFYALNTKNLNTYG